MVRAKVRIRFRKAGDLRLVSHHDLMRTFERMLRRAALPFHSTAGFNPKPRMVFALSLGLGIVGTQEVLELELDAELSPEEVHERLGRQCPPGLEILSVCRIDPKTTAQVRRVIYRLPLSEPAPEVPARAAALLARADVWVERSKPQPRRCDIRPYLSDLRALPGAVELEFWVTPTGTARPDEVLGLMGLRHLLDEGAVLERASLELHDEHDAKAPECPGASWSGAPPSSFDHSPSLKGNA
jgi:radical SAM-linked protein